MSAGYLDLDGQWAIQPEYQTTSTFCNGVAAVWRDGIGGTIDHSNHFKPLDLPKSIVPPGMFEGRGVSVVEYGDTGKFGVIDRYGEIVIPVEFDFIFSGNEGIYRVQNADERYAFFTDHGKPLTDFVYTYAKNFYCGHALVKKAGAEEFEFINLLGETVFKAEKGEFVGNALGTLSQGCIFKTNRAVNMHKGIAFKNLRGDVLIQSDEKRSIVSYDDGFFEARDEKTGLYGLIDFSGNWVLKPQYSGVRGLTTQYGMFVVGKPMEGPETIRNSRLFNQPLTLVDIDGRRLLKRWYKGLVPLAGARAISNYSPSALIARNQKSEDGVIDFWENILIPFRNWRLDQMSEGMIPCRLLD